MTDHAIGEYQITVLDMQGDRRPAFYVFAYNNDHAIQLAHKLSPGASSIKAALTRKGH